MKNRYLFSAILLLQLAVLAWPVAAEKASSVEDLVRKWLSIYEKNDQLHNDIVSFQQDSAKIFSNFELWHEITQDCPDYKKHKRMIKREKRLRELIGRALNELVIENQKLQALAADFRARLDGGEISERDLQKLMGSFDHPSDAELTRAWTIIRVGQTQILLDHGNYTPSRDIY